MNDCNSHSYLKEEINHKRVTGLLDFARGVLDSKNKVQMTMKSGLGVFHENEIIDLPGIHFDCDDGAWLRIERQRESKPPKPSGYIEQFLDSLPSDPKKRPELKPALSVKLTIEEASDLAEAGLLKTEYVSQIIENDAETGTHVKATLFVRDCIEIQHDFEKYIIEIWTEWSKQEQPVRRAISLYNDLFKIHSAIHTPDSTPPELIWGIGIGRWKHGRQHSDPHIEMPLIEQSVDIDLEDGGTISIRPRDLSPHLSLKPYIEIQIEGADKLQNRLQEELLLLLQGDDDLSPFTTVWEPILDSAVSNLSSTARHITRAEIDDGLPVPSIGDNLCACSDWAIFGRPRSHDARSQDLEALKKQIEDNGAEIPPSILGYVTTASETSDGDISDWGLDDTRLQGGGQNKWTEPGGGISDQSATPRESKHSGGKDRHHVHFFPLPFNEEQAKISDMIDDPSLFVATVSGPPGTGKSHSIANIISHQMATGKRVLVTARTPEAIAAVREKLPSSLQSLVISSVGTDRESAKQLQNAVSELSTEIVNLDKAQTLERKATLEQEILECDRIIEKSDHELAVIARANLTSLEWDGQQQIPMTLVDILAREAKDHDWFTDRPTNPPPAQLAETLWRLRQTLPELAADIAYAGINLPATNDLPTTNELIDAHKQEMARNTREVIDYSSAPKMARDSVAADKTARGVLAEIGKCLNQINCMAERARRLAIYLLQDDKILTKSHFESVKSFIENQSDIEKIYEVYFEIKNCNKDKFLHAAKRGEIGRNPILFSLFNDSLKKAISTIRVRGKAPRSKEDWNAVVAACLFRSRRDSIDDALRALVQENLIPSAPEEPWSAARYLIEIAEDIKSAQSLSDRLRPVIEHIRSLFPYGLDINQIVAELNLEPAAFALKANLPEEYCEPDAVSRLAAVAGEASLPVFSAMHDLKAALGKPEVSEEQIVEQRGGITDELTRLVRIAPDLVAASRDLEELSRCGAPELAARLKTLPEEAVHLIPETWQKAWAWAQISAQVNNIVDLGNGDNHRQTKAETLQRRHKLFEELIRIRTLLGLSARMKPSVHQALEAYTQAVAKIGAGKGKKVPRFIRAAQKAARNASAAAPVWIMPEYKIPEQLPAQFADFDLVILDEASQSDITALSAIARGKKTLIVGDEEQVSPAAVGISIQRINALRAEFLEGLPGSDLIDENSSIFEITKRMHPENHVMLREHFRCVAPIIQFSTRYYKNLLIPLRVPKASERFDPPLCDVFIKNAQRHGKINPDEARWIVDEVARIIEEPIHQKRDIGIISLIGSEQAENIERMLLEDKRIGPEIVAKRRIICGDARTMQGQERSIIFLSMVASPGNARAQTAKADNQRINVAMSRARDRLYLVRSIQLKDLQREDIKADILHHFEDPMPNGRTIGSDEKKDLMGRCESGFEREVLDRLLNANYRVRPQVAVGGFSIDMVVEGKDDRRLAIELDGDRYHGPEVWDRDVRRQTILERAGWVFWRVFGSQWNADKDYWWEQLQETLKRLEIDPIGATALDERFTKTIIFEKFEQDYDVTSDNSPEIIDDKSHLLRKNQNTEITSEIFSDDTVHSPESFSLDSDLFYEIEYLRVIKNYSINLIDSLGPITFSYLCERIARAHGFQRTGSKIKKQVWAACSKARKRTLSSKGISIFWPHDIEPEEIVPFRGLTISGAERSWNDVPYPEKLGLVQKILNKGHHNDITTAIANEIGLGRLSSKTRKELEELVYMIGNMKNIPDSLEKKNVIQDDLQDQTGDNGPKSVH